eukprot:IDg1057t1
MDSDNSNATLKLPKLRNDNFHSWKYRIELALALRDVLTYIQDDPPLPDSPDFRTWEKGDVKARATIGITLNDEHMEQVLHCTSARHMWKTICDIFEKHTLLNKLAARRNFYTATMTSNENVNSFCSRIRQLAGTLRSMGVILEESEMAMALLNGLPERFDGLISALDALGNDDKIFTLEFVKSRCAQEEQRHSQRDKLSLSKSESAALVANRTSSNETCVHCGKHKDSNRCYTKYPHLAPPGHFRKKKDRALVGQVRRQQKSHADEFVCLLGKDSTCSTFRKAISAVSLNTSIRTHSPTSGKWIIDSGCTKHFTFDRAAFVSYQKSTPTLLDLGASSTAEIVGKGSVSLELIVKGKHVKCTINNVNHVPDLRYQLLSVSTMAKLGIQTTFSDNYATLTQKSSGKLLATGSMVKGLYTLDTLLENACVDTALVASLNLWHQRLGHVSPSGIKSMADNEVVHGIELCNSQNNDACIGCILGKGTRAPIPKSSSTKTKKVLELVHSDVMGPLEVPSVGRNRYIITFIDDYSNWTVEYTMQNKESCDVIKLKALRSDNGGEYLSNEFKTYLITNGIKHQLTVAYTPQQNGVAERMNRTLLNLARSMLHHKGIDKKFWAEAISTAVYIRNRVTSRALPSNTTPHHIWHNSVPNVSHLRVF